MVTKRISSTDIQNNFGRILDDVVQNGTRYIVQRHNSAKAVLIGLADLESLLSAPEPERHRIKTIIHEMIPDYSLGETVEDSQ